jgi:hypothetical protein
MSDFIIKPTYNGGTIIPAGGMERLTTSSRHYEVIGERMYIAYYQGYVYHNHVYQNAVVCKCDVKYHFESTSTNPVEILSDNNIEFRLGMICCDFCDNTYNRGFIDGNGSWYCMSCFSKTVLLATSIGGISMTYGKNLMINEFDDRHKHMHLGYIVADGSYTLNFINRRYYENQYERYYKPGNSWKGIVIRDFGCKICHNFDIGINDDDICYNCYKFVEARFLRENAVKVWFLREICARDIVLDIYYLVMSKIIELFL